MTEQSARSEREHDGAPWDFTLAPARPATDRRNRANRDEPPQSDNQADLERGRTTALIASLGRLQLTLDVLARRIAALEATVTEGFGRLSQQQGAVSPRPERAASNAVPDGQGTVAE